MPDNQNDARARHLATPVREALNRFSWDDPAMTGAGPAEFALPSGTVAFLLTDVEGSTLWDVEPDRMHAAMPWPTSVPLRVRMAVHAGEARFADDGNYAGQAIIRTARLRAIALGVRGGSCPPATPLLTWRITR